MDLQGITLSDLQTNQPQRMTETLLSFSILAYTLDTASLESLEYAIESMSQQDIQYDNVDAFEANGFSIGDGSHEEGVTIAQKLQSIGAVRISQNVMVIPPGSDEILHSVSVVGPRAIIFSTSSTGAGGGTISSGKLGWILSANSDASAEPTVDVVLCPAFWKLGAGDLRMISGEEPFQFQYFDVGRVRLSMEIGEFIILAPTRAASKQDTLDSLLFEVPGKDKVLFFVIVFRGSRQVESH